MVVSFICKKIKGSDIVGDIHDALRTDGAHHKQWYLEEILKKCISNFEEVKERYEWEDGIPP